VGLVRKVFKCVHGLLKFFVMGVFGLENVGRVSGEFMRNVLVRFI